MGFSSEEPNNSDYEYAPLDSSEDYSYGGSSDELNYWAKIKPKGTNTSCTGAYCHIITRQCSFRL